jgi:putative endonuclease
MTNRNNKVLYTGVTNNLIRRSIEHRTGRGGFFTRKYKVWKLVYYEIASDPYTAIEREKQIKAGSRAKKVDLIEEFNPLWKDLHDDFLGDLAN